MHGRDPFGYERTCSADGCTKKFWYDHEEPSTMCCDCHMKAEDERWNKDVTTTLEVLQSLSEDYSLIVLEDTSEDAAKLKSDLIILRKAHEILKGEKREST